MKEYKLRAYKVDKLPSWRDTEIIVTDNTHKVFIELWGDLSKEPYKKDYFLVRAGKHRGKVIHCYSLEPIKTVEEPKKIGELVRVDLSDIWPTARGIYNHDYDNNINANIGEIVAFSEISHKDFHQLVSDFKKSEEKREMDYKERSSSIEQKYHDRINFLKRELEIEIKKKRKEEGMLLGEFSDGIGQQGRYRRTLNEKLFG
ncbi:hypothetical protein ACFLZB_02205 [Nanoarchaeota archaeon]